VRGFVQSGREEEDDEIRECVDDGSHEGRIGSEGSGVNGG
jgi:hypothetical protein